MICPRMRESRKYQKPQNTTHKLYAAIEKKLNHRILYDRAKKIDRGSTNNQTKKKRKKKVFDASVFNVSCSIVRSHEMSIPAGARVKMMEG